MLAIKKIVGDLHLDVVYDGGKSEVEVNTAETNRPGLQLAGFYNYFVNARVQVIGNAEASFVAAMSPRDRKQAFDTLFSYSIPFVCVSRSVIVSEEMLASAKENGVAIFKAAELRTAQLEAALGNYLGAWLAPTATMHAVLIDIYGTGVLLTGKSGIGKSETALELVKRGHQFIADDAVELKRIAEDRLIGEAPEVLKHLMEIRGVGIINIEHMFGISAVLDSKSIDLVVQLELWNESKEYDRLGLEDEKEEILGVLIPKLLIPVRPGRNLAIILETAARNVRLKKAGYNALDEINERKRQAEE